MGRWNTVCAVKITPFTVQIDLTAEEWAECSYWSRYIRIIEEKMKTEHGVFDVPLRPLNPFTKFDDGSVRLDISYERLEEIFD
jgi:hypothetical protein